MKRVIDVLYVPGFLAQIAVKAGGIEATSQDVVSKLEGIVILVKAVELQLLREIDRVLHLGRIRDIDRTRPVRRNGRQNYGRFGAGRFPFAKALFDHRTRFFGSDIANRDDGGQIGPECIFVVGDDVVMGKRRDGLRCGFAQKRIALGEERRVRAHDSFGSRDSLRLQQ